MLKNLIAIAFLVLSVLFVSCKGDQGEVGPAGTTGAKGDVGAQGPKGDSGVNGQDGQDGLNGIGARVISTGAVKSYEGGYTLGKSNLTKADSAFIANSIIQVYIRSLHKTFNQARTYAMPGKAYWDENVWTAYQFFSVTLNSRLYVSIVPDSWSEDQPTAPERDFVDIRAVIIPAVNFRANANVDYSNYEETMKSLGLTEADVIHAD